MNFAKAFRILRAAFGLTQSELASRLSIGASHLSLIESGKRQPSHKTITSISQKLGVPVPLISLLASDRTELESQLDNDVTELSKLLLRLLVGSSNDNHQINLPFEQDAKTS